MPDELAAGPAATAGPTLLSTLLRKRHWRVFRTFEVQFARAAREVAEREQEPAIANVTVSPRTFERWYHGQVKNMPRPDASRVLEHLFGLPVEQLLGPADAARSENPEGAGKESPASGQEGDRADFTMVVERYMSECGMSVRATAKAAGYSDHTLLSKVLNGHKPVTHYLAMKLDRALSANGEITAAAQPAIAQTATPRSSGPPQPVPSLTLTSAGAPGNSLSDSVELLRQEMNEVFSRGAITDSTVDDWERTAIRYARATRDRPPTVLIADLGTDLGELNAMLGRQLPASSLRRLTRVAAQMSGLMCLTFCILDDRPAFRRWARTARIAGAEAGDPETISWLLAQEAHGHYYSGDVLEAIDVARHAYETPRTPCTGAALGAALEARAQAALGRNEETRSALARAEDTLSRLSGDVLVPSAFGYNEASFRFHEGNAYTHLRDVKSAFKAQDRALELCDPANYTDWAMTRLDRAQCLIHANDIMTALEYAVQTISSLSESKRLGIISLRAQEIMQTLPEMSGSIPAARDLGELLMLTTGTSEADSR